MRDSVNGLRFRVWMSMALAMIVASAILGIDPRFPAAPYAAAHEPWSVAIGDLNADQLPDLAAVNAERDTVRVSFVESVAGGPCDFEASWDGTARAQ